MLSKIFKKIYRETIFYIPIASVAAYVIGSLYTPITSWVQFQTAFIVSSVFYGVMRFVMGYAVDKILKKITPVDDFFSRKTFIIHISVRLAAATLAILLALWIAERLTGINFLKIVYVQLFVGLLITLVIMMSLYAAKFYREMVKKIIDAQNAKQMAMRSELKALQAQVNPHFLFNTLNSISALIPMDPVKADFMIQKLADIFRYVLVASEKEKVTLQEELLFIDNYLEIEKTRFDDKLKIEHKIDPLTLTQQLPSLILQPIIENAIKHGIAKNIDGGTIILSSTIDDGQWKVTIEDDGNDNDPYSTSDGLGLGLKNVNERIKKTYGEFYGVKIEPADLKGMRAVITMPRIVK